MKTGLLLATLVALLALAACQAGAAGVSRHTPGECDPSKLRR
jgi:hypothetical protein